MTRLERLADNYPAERKDGDSGSFYWQQIVNAWFLCGLIRQKDTTEASACMMLNGSDAIVWG